MAAFKRISQNTFDEVVRENVEEFDMDSNEALKDAINQFIKQGVDLTRIDTTGGIGRKEMLDAMKQLKLIPVPCIDLEYSVGVLKKLTGLCDKNHPLVKRNLMLMNEQGGVNDLHLHLVLNEEKLFQIEVICFLGELSSSEETIRDFFEPGGSDHAYQLLTKYKQSPWSHEDLELLEALLTLIRIVIRTERNKNAIMKAGTGAILSDMLIQACSDTTTMKQNQFLIEKICLVIRGLSIHDDYRSEMSCAFDNGKYFLKQSHLIPSLMQLVQLYDSPDPEQVNMATAGLLAIKAMITTNDAVQIICLHGMIERAVEILCNNHNHESNGTTNGTDTSGTGEARYPVAFLRALLSVLRNVAADDLKKEQFISQGGLEQLVRVMLLEPYVQDSALMEHGMGCLAQFSLRSPVNSIRIMNTHVAIPMIIQAMRKFVEREALQRQGCLLIRNIAGRCPELRNVLLDAGIEPVLRAAGRYRGVVDEAYSALRDLGCEVQYVKMNDDGTVAPAYETFGVNSNKNFRPIYDDVEDYMNTRIEQEGKAPFANQDHDHYHIDHDEDDEDECGCGHTH